jgi:hypothetical protein|tara:strand:+ start:2005 stop:2241 length:237 start_codon:yes stop_codon:yes gene_type:complete
MFSYKEIKKLSIEFPNDWDFADKIRTMINDADKRKNELSEKETRYIYERNPDTGEIFRRKSGDYDSPRELIDKLPNKI